MMRDLARALCVFSRRGLRPIIRPPRSRLRLSGTRLTPASSLAGFVQFGAPDCSGGLVRSCLILAGLWWLIAADWARLRPHSRAWRLCRPAFAASRRRALPPPSCLPLRACLAAAWLGLRAAPLPGRPPCPCGLGCVPASRCCCDCAACCDSRPYFLPLRVFRGQK